MSEPVTYEKFCEHYELDENSEESKEEYKKYKENLAVFQQPK